MSTPTQESTAKRQKMDDGTVVEQKKTRSKVPRFLNPTDLVILAIDGEPGGKDFKVHKEVACDGSPVFKAAFSGNFIKGQTQTYKLDDTTPRAVRLLCGWLYTRELDVDLGRPWAPEAEAVERKHEMSALIELWVLADKLFIPQLQNLAIQTLDELRTVANANTETVFSYYVVYSLLTPYIYKNTAKEMYRLRLLCAYELVGSIFHRGLDSPGVLETLNSLPPEARIDVEAFLRGFVGKQVNKTLALLLTGVPMEMLLIKDVEY